MPRSRALAIALFVAASTGNVTASSSAEALRFRFPVDNVDGNAIWPAWIIGVDHDPETDPNRIDCLSHSGQRGFPFCYDGHKGTDFILDGSFDRMDRGSAAVLAAADGVVITAVDGNYDRCHGDSGTMDVTCDGHEMHANKVAIEHADGTVTWYVHLKSGSVVVEEGDEVTCGDMLGLIGSSGRSSMPHLHFEVHAPDGAVVDPYSGPESQAFSYWVVEDGVNGVPAELCQGEEPPPADVVEDTSPDVVDTPDTTATPDVTSAPDDIARAPDAANTLTDDDAFRADPDTDLAADAGATTLDDVHVGGGLPWGCSPSPRPTAPPAGLLLLLAALLIARRRHRPQGGR